MSGYVRIHRSLCGHPAFRNDAEAMAFAWMIAKAAWRPTKVRYKGHDIMLDRGQLTVSVRDFADAMDRPKGWAERLLSRLREHGMILQKNGTQVGTQVGTRGGTLGGTPAAIITICNYELFQASSFDDETPNETLRETDARQRQDTEQIREEGNKDNCSASQSVARHELGEAVSFFNSAAKQCGWRTVAKLSDKRSRALKARLREHGLEGWKAAIARARASPFLGRDPPTWFTFDFLLSETNFLKVIEGNYDKRHTGTGDATFGALADFNHLIASNVGFGPGDCQVPEAGGPGEHGPGSATGLDRFSG